MKIRLTHRFLAITFLLMATGVTRAQSLDPESQESQEASTAVPEESSGQTLSQIHHEVTVTATRAPTELRQIGQSLTLITAEDIEAQGARDVLQILETVPGFNVARSGSFGGTTSVFVRGGESDFNLVLIDGVQVNQPGGFFDFADLTTTNVERIEIVRGPSSVLYGADAMTSTIHIITRKGEGQPSGNLRFEGGTFNTYLVRGAIQGKAEKLHYTLGGHYSQSDGLYELNNQYDKLELSANTAFDLNSSSSISGNVRYLDSQYHFPTDGTGAVVDPNDFRKTKETLYSASYENLFTNRYSTKVHYGYHRRVSRSFTVEDSMVDLSDSVFETIENRNYLDWQNNLQLDPRNMITAGVSYEREESETGNLDRRSVGLYLQEQFSWADRFFLTVGGRYDNNDRFESFATGSVSMAYLINDEVKLRASLGNGFRAPSFFDIVGLPSENPFFNIKGNADLKPEKNVATDFGLDYFSRNNRSGVSGTVFFNRFSDLIEFSFSVPPGTPNFINVEKARSQGVELEGFIAPTEELRGGAYYTLTDTKVTDAGTDPGGNFVEGEQLLRRPRHVGGVYAQFRKIRYNLRIDFKYKGKRDDRQFFPDFSVSRVVLPAYWKVDFGVTVPIVQLSDSPSDVAMVFRGENIFNKKYTELAGFESLGRSLTAGLEVTF
ncbi:MAG: TonB-dependent receptor [Acidobacteria bacterium]|nr:TonB-dependent receptor [Acidobacteriota bacterium]